jgi:hypothetical protein
MDERATSTRQRLRAPEIKLAEQHRAVVVESGVFLDELVALVHDLEPVRRQTIWQAVSFDSSHSARIGNDRPAGKTYRP